MTDTKGASSSPADGWNKAYSLFRSGSSHSLFPAGDALADVSSYLEDPGSAPPPTPPQSGKWWEAIEKVGLEGWRFRDKVRNSKCASSIADSQQILEGILQGGSYACKCQENVAKRWLWPSVHLRRYLTKLGVFKPCCIWTSPGELKKHMNATKKSSLLTSVPIKIKWLGRNLTRK